MRKIDEEVLRIVLNCYDGNHEMRVDGDFTEFPINIRSEAINIFRIFNQMGLITGYVPELNEWGFYLTSEGIDYFSNKEKMMKNANGAFKKLPNNSRKLLNEIISSDNSIAMLCERLSDCPQNEADEIWGILEELKIEGFIHLKCADNLPYILQLTNKARTYEEELAEYENSNFSERSGTLTIGTFNNYGGVFAMGDISNSTVTINNSISSIEKQINENGGADKEALLELLNEAKEVIENLRDSRKFPKNSSFIKRIGVHFEKHQWFYSSIVELFGKVVLGELNGTE